MIRLCAARTWRQLAVSTLLGFALLLGGCGGGGSSDPGPPPSPALSATPGSLAQPSPTAWSFGVMGDTQWMTPDDGLNPHTVSAGIINQINRQFIDHGVAFVVQVGDLSDSGALAGLQTRALFAQPLYNAGIGFFPLRGNHDDQPTSVAEHLRVFPQTRGGLQNATPDNLFGIYNPDALLQPFPARIGAGFSVGTNFSSPSTRLTGLSYAFDYLPGNGGSSVRLVLLDQFRSADGSSNTIGQQQAWIDAQLATRPAGSHAFVFGHKGLINAAHVDTLFGSDPSQSPAEQDAFIASMARNDVRYYVSGHDHLHDRSLVTTTDGGASKVQQVICAGGSSKFLTPANPANDLLYNLSSSNGFGLSRQTPVAQETYTVGYYIYTIDGSRVIVDYYSAPVAPYPVYAIYSTPALTFTRRESFGYSLGDAEFSIAQGASYTAVQDTFSTTTARILSGTNGSWRRDGSGRPLTSVVNTGWNLRTSDTASDILTLWGMAGSLGSGQTDTYVLSMSYDPSGIGSAALQDGSFGLATRDADGNWIDAVNQNYGGTEASKRFVAGPYAPGYTLGTYGVDTKTNTAWAVLNYNSDFAVALRPEEP